MRHRRMALCGHCGWAFSSSVRDEFYGLPRCYAYVPDRELPPLCRLCLVLHHIGTLVRQFRPETTFVREISRWLEHLVDLLLAVQSYAIEVRQSVYRRQQTWPSSDSEDPELGQDASQDDAGWESRSWESGTGWWQR